LGVGAGVVWFPNKGVGKTDVMGNNNVGNDVGTDVGWPVAFAAVPWGVGPTSSNARTAGVVEVAVSDKSSGAGTVRGPDAEARWSDCWLHAVCALPGEATSQHAAAHSESQQAAAATVPPACTTPGL
jgi:hypothetical protein